MAVGAEAVANVVVPSITNPGFGFADVTLSSPQPPVGVGDVIAAAPVVALPTNCVCLSAYVVSANTIRVVFGSSGGNVVGASKSFKFHIIYS